MRLSLNLDHHQRGQTEDGGRSEDRDEMPRPDDTFLRFASQIAHANHSLKFGNVQHDAVNRLRVGQFVYIP